MARSFSSGNYLKYNGNPGLLANVDPCTISAWFYPTSVSSNACIVSVGGDSSPSHRDECFLLIYGSTNKLRAYQQDAVGARYAEVNVVLTPNTLYHGCGVFRSSTDRSGFLNGGNEATDSVSSTPAVTTYRQGIGQRGNSFDDQPFPGNIAEVGVWNVALSDEEVYSLSLGYSPKLIRPQNLIMYVPLIRDNDNDLVWGIKYTKTGSPGIARHPRIIYPKK